MPVNSFHLSAVVLLAAAAAGAWSLPSAGDAASAGARATGRTQLIAYTVSPSENGTPNIYVMKTDGSGSRRLTWRYASSPAWSPDGRQIAFDRWRPKQKSDIYVMNADGSGAHRLTADGTDPAWAPDGRKIAFDTTVHFVREIVVVNADGSGRKVLLKANVHCCPAWSPDGRRIAFATDDPTGIGVMNADGSKARWLYRAASPHEIVEFPAWSPNGAELAYVSDFDDGSGNETRAVVLLYNAHRHYVSKGFVDRPSWSPDGHWITYGSGGQIYKTAGRTLRKLTNGTTWKADPAWSPAP